MPCAALRLCRFSVFNYPPESPIIWISSAEAAVHPEVAERELKKEKGYETSDVYNRAHHIIYGDKAPVGPDGRTRIAVIVNGDEDLVVEDRVKNVIYAQIRKKFPRENFAVMKGTDINTRLLQIAEDRYASQREAQEAKDAYMSNYCIVYNSPYCKEAQEAKDAYMSNEKRRDIDDVAVESQQPRGIADLGRADLVMAGQECNYDYVFLITLSEGNAHKYGHVLWPFPAITTHTQHSNIWLRIRFVDVAAGDYLYRNDLATTGKTHNGHLNGRAFEESVANGMKEAMNDIAIAED